MIDYLDPDIAYLLGLIVARGEIVESGSYVTITIEFPFKNLEVEGITRSYRNKDEILLSLDSIVNRIKALDLDIEKISMQHSVHLKISTKSRSLFMRNLRLFLGSYSNYYEFRVPKLIYEASIDLKKEFMRGFGDVAGSVRKSNYDQRRRYRVYIDVLNQNWKLPVDICHLLQDHLNVPVQTITWGHPNIRDPSLKDYNRNQPYAWAREHQIKVYAEAYLGVGFYIRHKDEILRELAQENIKRFGNKSPNFCNPPKTIRNPARPHPMENDIRLPEEIRGKHFDSYWQICDALGCPRMKKQSRLF